MTNLPSNNAYRQFFIEVKQKIKTAQAKAIVTVNQQMLLLYWDIGNLILQRQEKEGWGTKVAERLSLDLKKEFPGMKGFSKRNIQFMRQFAELYNSTEIVKQVVSQISWGHNIRIMQKCPDLEQRIWYARQSLKSGWSRNMLVMQTESDLFNRQGKAPNNFSATLPKADSELAQQIFKDPYLFDFLTLEEDAIEQDLEEQLLKHVTKFLLELGKGFAFVGRQYPLLIAGEDFRIDLLFYHLQLRRYVAIDLKMTKFKPEYAGKMNFYLSAIDDLVKNELDNPSIGIVLCKDKKNVLVEYALKDMSKPIGVSKFNLTQAIPEELKSSLPTIEDFEREIREADEAFENK